ncbi:GerAB/ArcD/ProY family transporter [Paenibacillus pinihumi]|uniref:GerAB/ArcD/ProY family transporter n=1 Tax=Paenibacillus pinihumi TaxID=669462 RepID=UPI000403FC17|nr:endospore germination permease [Paenibacillus pinihumi]
MQMEKGKISLYQFKVLVVLFSLGSSILIVPSALASVSRQDGWISSLFGVACGLLLVWLYASLAQRFPDKTLIEFSILILGKGLGHVVAFLYFSFFLLIASLVLCTIGDFISSMTLPETPIEAIHIVFMLIIVMGIKLGLEVVGRASEIFIPWVLVMLGFMLVAVLPLIDMSRTAPFLENSIRQIAGGSITILGIPYLELVIFLMILPAVSNRSKATKGFLNAALFSGLILTAITLLCILVLGHDFTARHSFPSYTLAKQIHIGDFFQRVEIVMAVIWFVTIFFKLMISFYAAILGFGQLFRLKSHRSLVTPFAMIVFVISLLVFPNVIYFKDFSAHTWPPFASTFGLLLPVLLAVVAAIRKL